MIVPPILQQINTRVNTTHYYVDDYKNYGLKEKWADIRNNIRPTGDCEDFAITKLHMLVEQGYPIEKLRLATCFTETNEYHAVLIADDIWVLDNRNYDVEHKNTLPYRWVSIQKTGGSREWVDWS
jgi:predicted transglutaminase-like cysteine proteinase